MVRYSLLDALATAHVKVRTDALDVQLETSLAAVVAVGTTHLLALDLGPAADQTRGRPPAVAVLGG
jgi:hypothetical protein